MSLDLPIAYGIPSISQSSCTAVLGLLYFTIQVTFGPDSPYIILSYTVLCIYTARSLSHCKPLVVVLYLKLVSVMLMVESLPTAPSDPNLTFFPRPLLQVIRIHCRF